MTFLVSLDLYAPCNMYMTEKSDGKIGNTEWGVVCLLVASLLIIQATC